jgi:sensor histidine kinase YesM
MINIDNSKFIFSDERKYRIKRHLLFWGFWGFWYGIVRWLNPITYKDAGHFANPIKILIETFFLVLPHTMLVYLMLYFILPRFIVTGKYIKASLWILLLLILIACVGIFLLISIPWEKVGLFINLKVFQSRSGVITVWAIMNTSYQSAMLGALTAAALAAGFKLFKHYYLKNHRIQQLLKENIEAQLQILRAQVHPHFLFNTLNNIFSQTQTESPKGSRMIMGLSDTLRYILYEGQKPLVPLRLELLMINEYINLEKILYGNKLDVHVLTPDKVDDIYIAPLLLLPFVENCFKHGTSHKLQNPWVNLTTEMRNTTLVMKLMNGKVTLSDNGQYKSGIGICNVKQRLDLLYKDKYNLQITEDDEVFIVDLWIELIRLADKVQGTTVVQAKSTIAYT